MPIPLPFRGDPPDRVHTVLREQVPYNPARWRQYLPDQSLWPDELDADATGSAWPSVDRERVLAVGLRAADPVGAAQTYVAAAVWGTGTHARGVIRRCRPLIDLSTYGDGDGGGGGSDPDRGTDGETVGARLAMAVELLLDSRGGPVAAYDALHGDGWLRVPYLGPSFGTKVLYFSGFDQVAGEQQPLILDRSVAAALNHLCGAGWSASGSHWTTGQYAAYLELAHAWAAEWGCRPDVVERVLSAIGHTDPIAVHALIRNPVDSEAAA